MRQTNDTAPEMTWTRLSRENLKRETESFLIEAQNNVMYLRNHYAKGSM